MRSLSPLLAALAAVAACATGQLVGNDAADQPLVSYYRGTITVSSPDQQATIASYPALVKRTLKPELKQIVEESVVTRPGEVDRHVVVYDLAGEGCAVNELDGAFSGTCELEGGPWSWHRRRAVLEMPIEGKLWIVEREDVLTGKGMVARRWLRTADGAEGPRMSEEYESIGLAEYEALYLNAVRRP